MNTNLIRLFTSVLLFFCLNSFEIHANPDEKTVAAPAVAKTAPKRKLDELTQADTTPQIPADTNFEGAEFSSNARWSACFTPHKKCTEKITDLMDSAQKKIYVQAYTLTSKPIASALVRAANRNVDVKVIFDHGQSQSEYSKILPLIKTKIKVYVDKPARLAHTKLTLIDDHIAVIGSFNYSHAADHGNVENIFMVEDPKVNEYYFKNWLRRYEVSQRQTIKAGLQVGFRSPGVGKAKRAISRMRSPTFKRTKKVDAQGSVVRHMVFAAPEKGE